MMKKITVLIAAGLLMNMMAVTSIAATVKSAGNSSNMDIDRGPGVSLPQNESEYHTELAAHLTELYEFKIKIDGNELNIPFSYKQMESIGWIVDGDGYFEIRPGTVEKSNRQAFTKGDMVIYAELDSGAGNEVPLTESKFCSLFLSTIYTRNSEVMLPGNIILGKSNMTELKAVYGEPSYIIYEDTRRQMHELGVAYKVNDVQFVEFYYTGAGAEFGDMEGISQGVIRRIYIKNE